MSRPQLGARFEVGKEGDSTLYELVSLCGPMAPRYPVALRIIRPAPHLLAEWDRFAERRGFDKAEHRQAMQGALCCVPEAWLDMPFVRPVGRSAA